MTLEQWYRQMPVVTRSYLTLSFLTTAGCALELISPFSVYYNSHLIFRKGQVWRLATNFFFFGSLGMDFVFHMFFLSRYCRLLEEGTFRGRSGDFFWMLWFGAGALSCAAPFVNVQFLGSSLTFMMVYVWGRRNRLVNMSFLGLFSFTAPYLPWVLLAFSAALGSAPATDVLGIASGHAYYFLNDVYPTMTDRRILKTPRLVKKLFGQPVGPEDDVWGAGNFVPEPHAGVFAGGGMGRALGGGDPEGRPEGRPENQRQVPRNEAGNEHQD
jgi:Derlin-2/3